MAMTADVFEAMFPIVEASKLTLKDKFLAHEPETEKQADVKEALTRGIELGLSDFRKPVMDYTEGDNENIFFIAGKKPAIGHSVNWGVEKVHKFMPSKNSRPGTKRQYAAFLGILIKELIDEEKYTINGAWKAVCDDSRSLGHYWNSEKAKYGLEPTGSRKIGRWFDLANTYKVVTENEGQGFFFVSGMYCNKSFNNSLATVHVVCDADRYYEDALIWTVLDV